MRESIKDQKISLTNTMLPLPHYPSQCEQFRGKHYFLKIDEEAKLYLETLGEGIPVVFLHGGPGSTHHYFHSSFRKEIPGLQLIWYDQRGCGRSSYNANHRYTIQEAVSDLEKVRLALGLEKWFVVGHSYGGFLAQLYKSWFPDSLYGIVLVSASHGLKRANINRTSDRYLSSAELKRLDEIDQTPRISLSENIYNSFMNGEWKRQNYYKPTDAEMCYSATYEWDHDRGLNECLSNDRANYPLNDLFAHSQVPTLIIEGNDDPTWDQSKPKKLAANHPGAQLHVLAHASHEPFKDQPVMFTNLLLSFVKENT